MSILKVARMGHPVLRAKARTVDKAELKNPVFQLFVDSMVDIPADEVYQVWIEHDGQVSPSEIFVVDDVGHGSVAIPSMPANADRIMVTREPAGGAERSGCRIAAPLAGEPRAAA